MRTATAVVTAGLPRSGEVPNWERGGRHWCNAYFPLDAEPLKRIVCFCGTWQLPQQRPYLAALTGKRSTESIYVVIKLAMVVTSDPTCSKGCLYKDCNVHKRHSWSQFAQNCVPSSRYEIIRVKRWFCYLLWCRFCIPLSPCLHANKSMMFRCYSCFQFCSFVVLLSVTNPTSLSTPQGFSTN